MLNRADASRCPRPGAWIAVPQAAEAISASAVSNCVTHVAIGDGPDGETPKYLDRKSSAMRAVKLTHMALSLRHVEGQ
jgi:hypothetical protein